MIRGVSVIDGSPGTVRGPLDIVIQHNRITEPRSAGTPGLVGEHVHAQQGGTPLTYAYGLWLAHGVTTVRDKANTIAAPRIVNYQRYGFAAIRELELVQEAIRAHTRDAARTLTAPKGEEPEYGMVRVGPYAGLAIAPENPLLTLELKSPARVKKTRKVVIAVTSGKATRSFTVKLGKAAGGVLR